MNSLAKHARSGADDGSVAPTSAVERVTAQIRGAIREGRLVPGQRLVETDLTHAFDVSRPTLRNALSRLAAEGLVQISAHRGAIVRRMSRRDVEELYQLREYLEGLAAALAAMRIAEGADAAALRRLLPQLAAGMPQPQEGAEASARANHLFHQIVLEMSGNSRLEAMLERLNVPLFRLQFRGYLKPRVASQSATDHERIARAILDGDRGAAERTMRAHIRKSAAIILALPDDMFEAPSAPA